ncbi:MAG TPA: hypothetical protein PKC45_19235 [Gemmatales bacterium]|nr:hypothetical protein [Gemmatales bacterium]
MVAIRKGLIAALMLGLLAGAAWLGQQAGATVGAVAAQTVEVIEVGFASEDLTPSLTEARRPVYVAGFGHNRKATGVHDPIMARTVVLKEGDKKIALVSLDIVGYFHAEVVKVRERLPDFHYVLVTSTHNHEGPDTLGLWGPSPVVSGVDPAYLEFIANRVVASVRAAERNLKPAAAQIGVVQAPELLHDSREPRVLHDDLVVLRFHSSAGGVRPPLGLVVQWNCHPETMNSKNTELTADYVYFTIEYLRKKYDCPVVYLTGTVGGLMTSLHVPIKDEAGNLLKDGTWDKTRRYGERLGAAGDRALARAEPVRLTPMTVRARQFTVAMTNPLYHLGRKLGVLKRDVYVWTGNPADLQPGDNKTPEDRMAVRTEVAALLLGELHVACIPGEIYPELVLDKIQDPVDPGADFPEAPKEPAIYPALGGRWQMIIGLANDQLGYILPKRQWDEKPPFCYGRQKKQYGEENSIGSDAAPTICGMFQELMRMPR